MTAAKERRLLSGRRAGGGLLWSPLGADVLLNAALLKRAVKCYFDWVIHRYRGYGVVLLEAVGEQVTIYRGPFVTHTSGKYTIKTIETCNR